MTPGQLKIFVDPVDGKALELRDANVVDGQVKAGALSAGPGGSTYPILAFVPRFVAPQNYADNFGLQWQAHRRTQLDSQTGSTLSRDRMVATTNWPADMRGMRILEAGSGAGRFTEILAATGGEVVSFDYSSAAVANYENNRRFPNVAVFQGDIYQIPLRKASFDKVICLGVLQHTPDVGRSFRSLAEMVRPGGELVVDVYPRRLRAMLHWKYALRPLTTSLPPPLLYRLVSWYAPKLVPVAKLARRVAGRAGQRLVPILDQSDKPVAPEVQRDWTVLDTYDALSAKFDTPQTPAALRRFFEENGFVNVEVLTDVPKAFPLFGRGRRPL